MRFHIFFIIIVIRNLHLSLELMIQFDQFLWFILFLKLWRWITKIIILGIFHYWIIDFGFKLFVLFKINQILLSSWYWFRVHFMAIRLSLAIFSKCIWYFLALLLMFRIIYKIWIFKWFKWSCSLFFLIINLL